MEPLDTFDVTFLGATVVIDSNAPDVRARMIHEFDPFYAAGDASSEIPLARVQAVARRWDGDFDYDAGEEVVLHDGTYDTGLRRARVRQTSPTTRSIWSYDSNSLMFTDDESRRIEIYNPDAHTLSLTVRRIVRNQTYVPWAESAGGVSFHGAGFRFGDRGFLAVGNKGAGKTSVFLAAMLAGARDNAATFLSGDRVIVSADPSPYMAACPESMNIFPGALRQVPELAHLAAESTGPEWEQASKIRFPWRTIFKALGAQPEPFPARLDVMIHPRYRGGLDQVIASPLGPDDIRTRLHDHRITGRDKNRPNWLAWFSEADHAPVEDALAGLTHIALEWSHLEHLEHWFLNGMPVAASAA